MGCDRWVCGRTSFRFVRDAAQNLPLPIGLMDRPAVNGPAAGADHVRFSVFVHVQATFLLGWFEFLANTVGIAAAMLLAAVLRLVLPEARAGMRRKTGNRRKSLKGSGS